MDAYALQGHRQLAVRTYNRCNAGLRDLGLEPSTALEQAYGRAKHAMRGVATSRSTESANIFSNLPTPLTSFVGRAAEQTEVSSLVGSSALVTITGQGGSGKTRLALEVAARLLAEHEGAFFVDLAPVHEEAQVPSSLAAAVGVREHATRPLGEVMAEALSGQDLLIVIDNCGACRRRRRRARRNDQPQVLEGPPAGRLREPLGVEGEHVYRLGPLSFPAADAHSVKDLEGSDAVQLLAQRARAYDSTFRLDDSTAALVSSICRTVDGIPLRSN